MKRGGLFFAAFLLVSGVLQFAGVRVTSSHGRNETQSSQRSAEEKLSPKSTYSEELENKIQEFLADRAQRPPSPEANNQPQRSGSESAQGRRVKSVIAILPDPLHTHLGLFFDRSIEAIQQGAQAKGYVFDRAAMPWARTLPGSPQDSENARKERGEQRENETWPGLLIFRAGRPSEGTGEKGDLFVWVVGETPTAGLNKRQFLSALKLMSEHAGAFPGDTKPMLLILGPTFSGSLDSLDEELRTPDVTTAYGGAFVYSGTTTSAGAMSAFKEKTRGFVHFASFQENDDYARARFLQFACDRGYQPYEIAVLSEDETVYGSIRPGASERDSNAATPPGSPGNSSGAEPRASEPQPCEKENFHDLDEAVVQLHFPREISYFRSAYQKAATAQPSPSNSSAVPTLPMNLDESGADDDSVPPYAVAQTALSQEAVMLGIVGELQKHRIKFTLLLATDPVDTLFLASYLRQAYAQGQVVISVPDLLFAREAAPGLQGVLSLNTYSLVPGLGDQLCRQKRPDDVHQDRLYVSSGNIGMFNAAVGLLSEDRAETSVASSISPAHAAMAAAQAATPTPEDSLPYAPYAEYGSPALSESPGQPCQERPLLWLTILGRDGFWPVVGLSDRDLHAKDRHLPTAFFDATGQPSSTLRTATSGDYSLLELRGSAERKARTPAPWKIAYCVCLMLLTLHVILSLSGNILADSETRAQFARTTDSRGNMILATGALALAAAFVLLMCTRVPLMDWAPGRRLAPVFLWLPFLLFVVITFWDLARLRRSLAVASFFIFFALLITFAQVWLTWFSSSASHVYWSTRMLFLSSGVSPILPVLLLMGAGYWWMWVSLRGVCLVDLRRPRLPGQSDLPREAYRVSDEEGEDLRKTAHPFFFAWLVVVPVFVLAAIVLTVLDLRHPVQTVEGRPFDWGYTLLLGLIVGTFLGCLFKLVRTWLKCRQVLAGLDRLPLRVAFTRMKELCWHSFWNPGGSSVRETYKLMQRATENQTHLLALVENWNTPMADDARRATRKQIRATINAREALVETYSRIFPEKHNSSSSNGSDDFLVRLKRSAAWVGRALASPCRTFRSFVLDNFKRGCRMKALLRRMEALQKEMARTAGVLVKDVLSPLWNEDPALTVSTEERIPNPPLPVFRALAEEYAALVYVNFLVSVLLRIRTLVICAGGLYVLIVLSLNTYPFEPRPALQSLAVLLILAMAATVGYVYAEMHRDGILSYLTSTAPGELGLDFWVKFVSAGAIPVFSLLAAQFPSINQFLFSWLEPALQALK